MNTPNYHHQLHQETYDTSIVSGIDGHAAFLGVELDDILYPNDTISPFATNVTWLSGDYQTKFIYDFAPKDATLTPWVQERTVLEVLHTKSTRNLGYLAVNEFSDEAYAVTVKNIFLKRNAVSDVIKNEYLIEKVGNDNHYYYAKVKRSNFQLENYSGYEVMTRFDAEQLFLVIDGLYHALEAELVLGNKTEA